MRGALGAVVIAGSLVVGAFGGGTPARAQTVGLPAEPAHQSAVTPAVTNYKGEWRNAGTDQWGYDVLDALDPAQGQVGRGGCPADAARRPDLAGVAIGANPNGHEICGAPSNWNPWQKVYTDPTRPGVVSSIYGPNWRFIRRMVGLVYAQNNSNGPHTISTGWGMTGGTDTRTWLGQYGNCNGYGVVYKWEAIPAGSDYYRSYWNGAWPRAGYEDDGAPYRVRMTHQPMGDVQWNAWMDPYNYNNAWNNNGAVGWWYGCWKYWTDRLWSVNHPGVLAYDVLRPYSDAVPGSDPRLVQVAGWAWDPNVGGSTNVTIKIDGVVKGTYGATYARQDVMNTYNAAWPEWAMTNNLKGYNEVFALTPGAHTVCVSITDTKPTNGRDPVWEKWAAVAENCKTLTVQAPPTVVVPT